MSAITHEGRYRVRFDEAGPDGLARTSGLLRYAQDVAWRHSEAVGLDRTWYAERGLGWVVRAAQLEVQRPVPLGAELAVTTEVLGFQRIWARRRAECRLADGSLAAWVETDWVVLDGRGRLARVPQELIERFPTPAPPTPLVRVPQEPPPSGARTLELQVRRQDLDPMNHANNAVFVDWIEETLGPAQVVEAYPRRYRLEYAAAAMPGVTLRAAAWRASDDAGWHVRLTAPDGTVVLRASVEQGEGER
jgi:acyl-CoA thioester hydrolase